MIEVDMQVKGHSHGETDKKDPWFSVTLVGNNIGGEEISFKLTLKTDNESLFTSYPIGRMVSLKIHDPQRKLTEGPK